MNNDNAIKRLKLAARNVLKNFFMLDNPLSFDEFDYNVCGKLCNTSKLSIFADDFMTVLGVAGGEDIGYNWKYKRSFGNVYC